MVYSLTILLLLLGVYFTVNTFHRFEKRENLLTKFIQKNRKTSQFLGGVSLLGAFVILYAQHGFWTSFLMWMNGFVLMLMLIVLFNPIPKIKASYIFAILGCIFIVEILLTYAG